MFCDFTLSPNKLLFCLFRINILDQAPYDFTKANKGSFILPEKSSQYLLTVEIGF
jgi:hypothetical protein